MSVSTDVDIWRMSVGSVPKEEEMREKMAEMFGAFGKKWDDV